MWMEPNLNPTLVVFFRKINKNETFFPWKERNKQHNKKKRSNKWNETKNRSHRFPNYKLNARRARLSKFIERK